MSIIGMVVFLNWGGRPSKLAVLFPETLKSGNKKWARGTFALAWCFCFPFCEGAVLPVFERRGEKRIASVQCSAEERSTWKRDN